VTLSLPAVALVIVQLSGRSEARQGPRTSRLKPAASLILLLACAWLAVYFLTAISEPIWSNDFIGIWGYKAKTIFESRSIPGRLFSDPVTAYSHPEYPLTLPLVLASLAAWSRHWDDQALALFYPACAIATALILFGFLRRCRYSAAGAVGSLLLASAYWLYRPSATGMAEVPLALGMAAASSATLDLLKEASLAARGRASVALLFCAAIKQEGALFAVLLCILSLVACQNPPGWVRLLPWLLPPATLPPLLLRVLRGPLHDRDFDWSYLRPQRWPALLSRLGEVWKLIFTADVPPIALPLLALTAYFILTGRSDGDALIVVAALQIFVYGSVCAFTRYDPEWMVANAFARVSGALTPVFVLAIGSRYPLTKTPILAKTAE
jgi:hypothetical protein